MSFRLAAYAVCIEDGRVLLARYVSATGESGGLIQH
jgi:8-oxo-dGTP diphosphatase